MENEGTIYQKIKKAMDELNLMYEESEDSLEIEYLFDSGENQQEYVIGIRPRQKMLRILSCLPGVARKDRQMEMIFACCAVNSNLEMGQFSYHPEQRKTVYMMASPYKGCTVRTEWVVHQMTLTYGIVMKYGRLLEQLSEGRISFRRFMEKIEKF